MGISSFVVVVILAVVIGVIAFAAHRDHTD